MLDFEEELKKFHPSLEIDQVEENVYSNNLTGFHIQKICQHPVTEIRCRNG